jgi:restriction system protein
VWKVGVKTVRELYGVLVAENAARAILVASGEYTAEARTFARGKPLELVDGAALERMITGAGNVAPAPLNSVTTAAKPVFNMMAPSARPTLLSPAASVPACSLCGTAMVLRTAKRGGRAGAQFWGCSAYPKCKGTRDAAIVTTH